MPEAVSYWLLSGTFSSGFVLQLHSVALNVASTVPVPSYSLIQASQNWETKNILVIRLVWPFHHILVRC